MMPLPIAGILLETARQRKIRMEILAIQKALRAAQPRLSQNKSFRIARDIWKERRKGKKS